MASRVSIVVQSIIRILLCNAQGGASHSEEDEEEIEHRGGKPDIVSHSEDQERKKIEKEWIQVQNEVQPENENAVNVENTSADDQ